MYRRFLILVLFIPLFLHCSKEEQSVQQKTEGQADIFLDLNEVISKTPPELVSIRSTVELTFREPVVPDHLSGTVLDKNPFRFEPQIEGYAEWLSPSVLRFVPAETLPAGTEVEGNLIGKIAFGDQKDVNNFTFRFKVAEQEVLSLEGDFLAVTDIKNSVYYTGKLTFAQPVNPLQLQKDLQFEGPEGKLMLKVKEEHEATEINVMSARLQKNRNGKSYVITLPREYTADKNEWQKTVYLAGIDIFRVLAHMDVTEPMSETSVYALRFSDPIQKDTDLSGYVTMTPEIPFNTRIQGKYLYLEGDFQPGSTYTVTVRKGFPSVYGTRLNESYTTDLRFTNIKPEIQWLSRGTYLPASNNYKLQFKSVNVARAYLTVTEIYPQNIGFFIQRNILGEQGQPDNFRRYRFNNTSDYNDLNRVGEEIHTDTLHITDEQNRWIHSEMELSDIFKGRSNSVFVIRLQFGKEDLTGRCVTAGDVVQPGDLYFADDDYYSNPCRNGYYYAKGRLSKLLIASNIGLTVKKAADGHHVFATDILNARPLPNTDLQLYNYQNKLISTRNTDKNGHALFPDEGYYIYGKSMEGIALIKLDHSPWELNNFDVEGTSASRNGTDVFMYLDRGVHRPGDTVHFSAIIRLNREAPPSKQPVILRVKNPRGQLVLNKRTQSGINGHIYFPIVTGSDDPTGNWTAQVMIGDMVFTKLLRVETVKPNRLKVELDFPRQVKTGVKTLTGTIKARYLFGAPAAGLRSRVELDLTGKTFSTPYYRDYTFSSPLLEFADRNITISDENFNSNGEATLAYSLPDLSNAPGMVEGIISATVYERGGSYTERKSRTTIYPFGSFTGIENIFKERGAKTGEQYTLPVVVVDKEGNPLPGHTLKVSVYVNRRHWWWDYDQRGRKDFREMESTYLTGTTTYKSGTEPVRHIVNVEDHGRHYIEVKDITSGHETGMFFYASRWGGTVITGGIPRNYLEIRSDKNIYQTGDVATVSFETPSSGMACLALEQGSTVLHHRWKPVEDTRMQFTFPITKEMMPNCYASVTLIQPHNQNTNDLPMRIYGIKPIYVEDRKSRMPLTLRVPDELKPKEEFTVAVTSGASQNATCTITIVDEGLLDLTDFKTPSPWDHFFQKIRLGVTTTDNFDDILGILLPDIQKYFSIGGGMFEEERQKRLDRSTVKRFEAVVLFRGPVSLEPGKTKRTTFTMPNYVGSVRIMVVASAGHSYASAEAVVPVKQPLMVLPTVPRIARPGDIFDLPVSVFAMDSTIKTATVALETSGNLESETGEFSKNISFAEPGEQDTRFRLNVKDHIGAETIIVKAASGSHTADYTVHLPVSSPNPYYTEVRDTTIEGKQSIVFVAEKFGLEGTNSAKLAVSRLPDIQLDKRYNYLLRYPYGCIEQTVSAALPQLFLAGLIDLKPHQQAALTDHINTTITQLNRYQLDRGFAFWPLSDYGASRYSEWGTSYAGHFLLLAREQGFHVPENLFNHWLDDARRHAKKVNTINHRYQTYRLFLLALSGNTNMGAMNMVRENYLDELDALSRKFLAAAYFLSGRQSVAKSIDDGSSARLLSYREQGGTYGSDLRDRALMSYLCLEMDDQRQAASLLQQVAKDFRPGSWYSTQETAVSILAIGSYYRNVPFTGGDVAFRVSMSGYDETFVLKGYQKQIELKDRWNEKIRITNEHTDPVFATLFTEGVPVKDRIKSGNKGIEIKRRFFDENGLPATVESRSQGNAFWVTYTITNTLSSRVEELALSSVFPSGWEIINPRMSDAPAPSWLRNMGTTNGEYMDIRDDRVNWFFDLNPGKRAVFAIKVNPTFRGIFTLPPVVCEAMYTPEFFARIASGRVEVK